MTTNYARAPFTSLAGSSNVMDYDATRVSHDLWAAVDHANTPVPTPGPLARLRNEVACFFQRERRVVRRSLHPRTH